MNFGFWSAQLLGGCEAQAAASCVRFRLVSQGMPKKIVRLTHKPDEEAVAVALEDLLSNVDMQITLDWMYAFAQVHPPRQCPGIHAFGFCSRIRLNVGIWATELGNQAVGNM